MPNDYYVYVYLDPRKSGIFQYEDLTFSFEPFYVGKGIGDRSRVHLLEALGKRNLRQTKHHKYNKIRAILAEGLVPIILKLQENLEEIEAYKLEESYIKKIGCEDEKKGPLTNILKSNEFGIMPEEAHHRQIKTRRKNGNYVMSNEQKEKIRQAHLGMKEDPEITKKRVASRAGYRHSEETKQHIREGQKKDIAAANTKQSWQDPEIRNKRILGLKASLEKKKGIKRIWINNGEQSGCYEEQNALKLLEQGWVKGRLHK